MILHSQDANTKETVPCYVNPSQIVAAVPLHKGSNGNNRSRIFFVEGDLSLIDVIETTIEIEQMKKK